MLPGFFARNGESRMKWEGLGTYYLERRNGMPSIVTPFPTLAVENGEHGSAVRSWNFAGHRRPTRGKCSGLLGLVLYCVGGESAGEHTYLPASVDFAASHVV